MIFIIFVSGTNIQKSHMFFRTPNVQLLPSKGHRQRNKSQKEDRQYNQREMDPYITDTSMKEASSDSISSSSK